MHKWRPATEDCCVVTQLALPTCFHGEVLRLAHETRMLGHLSIRKTQEKMERHFYWPKLHGDVVNFCGTCHVCGWEDESDHPSGYIIPTTCSCTSLSVCSW